MDLSTFTLPVLHVVVVGALFEKFSCVGQLAEHVSNALEDTFASAELALVVFNAAIVKDVHVCCSLCKEVSRLVADNKFSQVWVVHLL